MKKHLRLAVWLSAMLFACPLFAQDWVRMMQDHNVNFKETQKAFQQYYESYKATYKQANGTEPASVPGHKIFKRWEWFMEPRVAPTGERFDPAAVWKEMAAYKEGMKTFSAGNWTPMGPSTVSGMAGAGRLNFVRVHPTNSSTVFVGSPSGGLWVSTNGGTSWTSYTDNLPQVIGCSDLAFDPVDPNVMYLATGDGDAGDNYTVGLLKSTDGGVTWNTTGLSFNMAQYRMMSRVMVDPNDRNIILVGTTGGIYRSTDAAVNFTLVQTGSFKDMERKPGTPTTIYASGATFYRSTDNGVTWFQTTSGLPAVANVSRMAIAVSAANANYVYLLAGLPSPNYGTEGFYRSTNSGASFSKRSTPSLGNQQWYDLCVASSPGNAEEVMIGGQTQFYKSTNGGTSWSQIATSTHVDYHDVVYTTSTTAYLGSDGGVWRTTNNGSGWTNLSSGLPIMQFYGFGHSSTTNSLLIAGAQDNGTSIYNGSWGQTMGGDGMLAFISWNNNNNMWGSQYNGSLNRSTNGGASWGGATSGITETMPWVTQWMEDPVTANTLYAGAMNLWKSTNGGSNWTKLANVNGSSQGHIDAIGVSPANNQVIWVAKDGSLFRSTNGGSSWTPMNGLPGGRVSGIACHQTDVNKTWVTFSGFANKYKVYQTTNQGTSWTNLSASLPNIPINCITIDKNGNDALYIGTDGGVYFKDATMNVWQPFFNGMPNVVVSQLQMYYAGNKIRASTYGRGMWESSLYVPGAYPPVANFGSNQQIGCAGLAVQFTDYSPGSPTSWSWTFNGGSPASAGIQNPLVTYNTPGTYPVTLTVTNGSGNDTKTVNSYITISSSPYPNPTASGTTICGTTTVNLNASGSGAGTLRWWDQPGGGTQVGTGPTLTRSVTGPTWFFVDETFPSGIQDFAGPFDYTFGSGSMFIANDIRGNYFDVLNPIILETVDVYSNSAGNRTIEVIDPQGNLYVDTTVFIPASPTAPVTVTLNFKIYPGSNYFIKVRGLVDLYRNSTGAVYPYTSSSVNITESNASIPGYYYFFYNWVYTEIICNTGRTGVFVNDTCSGVGIEEAVDGRSLTIFPNPGQGVFDVSFTAPAGDGYSVSVVNALGQTVYAEELTGFTGEYRNRMDIAAHGQGVYLLSVRGPSGADTVKKVVVY